MKIYQLTFKQRLQRDPAACWDFFSSPMNLSAITPPELDFQLVTDPKAVQEMYAGMIIAYKISPIKGIRLSWITEITHMSDKRYFIDEQRFGPYSFWHHQHHFKSIDGGTEMTDIVTYGLPFGILGKFANKLYVEAQLRHIFNYRRSKIKEIFQEI